MKIENTNIYKCVVGLIELIWVIWIILEFSVLTADIKELKEQNVNLNNVVTELIVSENNLIK